MSNTTTDEHSKLWDLIKGTRYAMLTHRHGDGQLHSHPLTTQNKTFDEGSVLYFFVPKNGEIVRHVTSDATVNLAYANTGDDSYVSISGQARLLEDQARKEELFTTMAKFWFPGGVTDPNLGLLAVHIVEAEYWDVNDSKMVQMFKMAKAAMSGKPPTNMGEHHKVGAV